jgi:hypothetical protein
MGCGLKGPLANKNTFLKKIKIVWIVKKIFLSKTIFNPAIQPVLFWTHLLGPQHSVQ